VATSIEAVGVHVPAELETIALESDCEEVADVLEWDCEEDVELRVLTRETMTPDSTTRAPTRMIITSVAVVRLTGFPPGTPVGVIGKASASRPIPATFRGNPS